MNESEITEGLVRKLEHAKGILEEMKDRVAAIRLKLDPIENQLRLQHISEASSQTEGTYQKIIILPSALEEDDPLGMAIQNLSESSDDWPTLVKLKDRFESEETCRAIVRIVEEKFLRAARERKDKPRIILILRWAYLPDRGQKKPIVYIGNRYVTILCGIKREFENVVEKCGFQLYQDYGEYGGGPIAYHLTTHFSKRDVAILQMTIHKETAKNTALVSELLHCVSRVKV